MVAHGDAPLIVETLEELAAALDEVHRLSVDLDRRTIAEAIPSQDVRLKAG
jgi:hypothetical protein